MPSKALVIFIATLSFGGVLSKPTVSRGNDGNGNVGFKYEVSHYPGNSRMHMKTGASTNNHQVSHDPYQNSKKYGDGGYISNPPSDYRPNRHYDNDVKTPIGHSSHERPEFIHEPQPEYQSPYDSASKNHYSGDDVYEGEGRPYSDNDAYPSSAIPDSPIPEKRDAYIHHPNKGVHVSEPYPNEYANAPIAHNYENPHTSHGNVDSPISQEHINPPISQEYINPHVPQEPVNPTISQDYIDPPVSQEYIRSPDSHEYANPHVVSHHSPQEPIYQPVSQEPVNHHISQEPLSPPLSQEYIPSPQEHQSPVVSQKHVEPVIPQEPIYPPVSQEYVSLPVSKKNEIPNVHHAEAVLVPIEYTNSPIEQEHIHPQISQEYIDRPVVSQKTVIPSIKQEYPVPSIPIVEPEPLEQVSVPVYDEQNKEDHPAGPKYQFVPSGPPYVTNSHSAQIIHPPLPDSHNSGTIEVHVDDSPSVAEFKPASVSHAFRLPISAPSAPYEHNIAPEDHIVDSLPTAAISHSTRLLIPSSGPEDYIGDSHQVAPISHSARIHVPSSGPEDHFGGSHSVAPISHSARIHVPSSGPEDHFGDSHQVAPISHSARIHVPSSGPEDHIGVSSPVAPTSHSTRLHIPSSYPSEEEDLESLLPKSQLDVKSPGSFQNIGGDLPPFAPFPQPTDFKSLQLEAEAAGNAPEPVEVNHNGPLNEGHAQPPTSHAFRLSLPGSIPSLHIPPSPNHGANPVEEKVSSSLNAPHAPLSHAFRLNLPSQGYPQDPYAGHVSKSSDSALLAVESKPKSIKA